MKQGPSSSAELTVHVKGKHLPITPALRDHVVAKMSRLDKYLDRLQSIEVELSTEKTRDAGHHNHVEATTHVAGKVVRVCTSHEDMYAAVDEAVDKLYRQLNRRKERLKGHHGTRASGFAAGIEAGDGTALAEPERDGVLPEIMPERLELEPMFDEEALAELQQTSAPFYVFLNARNEQINVLYRRANGAYGLIEPRAG